MNRIKIGVAEDQEIFRKGFVLLLNSFENIEVINEGVNGLDLLEQMAIECPDVAILDYTMPLMGGIETAKQIKKKYPSVKIIILSMYDDEEFVETAIENGANCYLSKDDDLNEIIYAIQGVLENNYYLNDRVSKVFINSLMSKGKINPSFISHNVELGQTEVKIIDLISKEFTTQEIADKLCKSTRTIDKYRTRMMEKTGTYNSVGLIMYAIKNKIIEI